MAAASIDKLIQEAQEDPEKLRIEVDALTSDLLEKNSATQIFLDSMDRFSAEWTQVSELRKQVDATLLGAKKTYKETLKKTENSALKGKPRLYWLAKALFATLRRHSLNYQVAEIETKIAALNEARTQLTGLLKRYRVVLSLESAELLTNAEFAESKSRRHAVDLQVEWERLKSSISQREELKEKCEKASVQQAVSDAMITEMAVTTSGVDVNKNMRKIDSPRLLTSQLPYLGFSNRPRLKKLIEQSEYSAQHAEQDLEKVREGLRLAAESSVDGRATSVSLEWLEYCKMIVSRYDQQPISSVTPH